MCIRDRYISGRGNIQQAALNAIKGFLAVNLFTVVPVRLYSLSVALQGTFAQGITGAGSGIGDLGAAILENMESTSLTEIAAAGHWGIGTNPLMLIFCIILMAYAVITVFFANLKRGGILLIQIAVGGLSLIHILGVTKDNGVTYCYLFLGKPKTNNPYG